LGGHFVLLSILSNITAGIILYINYPVKITVIKEDEHIICEIRDIGNFFITLRTPEKELIIEPNSKILQKKHKILS
tara:strand:+ start:863 stop:1090 length:228 start_codon:yes stop_codon:yes gene_type:complete